MDVFTPVTTTYQRATGRPLNPPKAPTKMNSFALPDPSNFNALPQLPLCLLDLRIFWMCFPPRDTSFTPRPLSPLLCFAFMHRGGLKCSRREVFQMWGVTRTLFSFSVFWSFFLYELHKAIVTSLLISRQTVTLLLLTWAWVLHSPLWHLCRPKIWLKSNSKVAVLSYTV